MITLLVSDRLAHFGCRNGTQVFITEGDVFRGTGHLKQNTTTKNINNYNYNCNYNTITTQYNMQL